MEQHLRAVITQRGLTIHGRADSAVEKPAAATPPPGSERSAREIDLISGEMHYFRIARRDWRRCLGAMRKLGLRIVSTYVPWGVHETPSGTFDFSGDLDLGAFLDEVARADMFAIVRPGPHINAELTFFGFPERILRDEEMLARSARDTPVWMPAPPRMFPVPSYASDAFQREVAGWFARVADIVTPRLAPDGPVVAVQADNEMQMFFRVGAYDHDYHPDAVAWWREFAPDLGEPPRAWDPDDAERCVAWVRFKEEYAASSLAWVARALRSRGLAGVPMVHNLPPTDPSHANLPRASAALEGVVGLDFYHRASDYTAYRRRALYLAGTAEKLPFAPELGVGGPLWLLPMSPEDQESVTLGLLAAGLRAFNLFMTVDRERYYGAPIAVDGSTRPPAPWLKKLLALLERTEWTRLRREAPVAILLSRADTRFVTASSFADPLTPVIGEFLRLGPAGAAELSRDLAATEQRRWFAAVEIALALAQVPYEIVDEECSVERLARYRAVVLPTIDRVDRAAWKRLQEVAKGKTRVICGPGRPTRDEYDRPLAEDEKLPSRAGLIREESRTDLPSLAADLEQVAGELPNVWVTVNSAPVDCSVFADPEGNPRLCFVGNREAEPCRAQLAVPAQIQLDDPFTSSAITPNRAGIAEIPLAPHQVRVFEISGTIADLGDVEP